MSHLSKPGIKYATAEMFGTAETLKKAVAPDCDPSGSLGVDMSPGNSSEVPHYVSCTLQVRVGTEPYYPAAAQRSVEMSSGVSACLSLNRNVHLITYSNILLGGNFKMRPRQPPLP